MDEVRGVRFVRGDLRLLPVALIAWVVGIASVLVAPFAWLMAAVFALATLVLFALAYGSKRVGVTSLVIACAAAAVVAGQVALAQPGRERAAEVPRINDVVATVTSKVEPATGGGWRFAVDTKIGGDRVSAAVFLRGEKPAELDLGAVIELTGQTADPFAGNAAAVRVIANDPPVVIRPPGGVLAIASVLRHDFSAMAKGFPGLGAELIPGLAVGDTTNVSEQLDMQMTQTSLSHLLAVSGANCAIITGAVFWLAGLCGAGRKMRVAIAMTALTGFIILVTPEPSVIRAGAMATGAMLALLLGRARAGLAILALAVTVLIIADPWLATSIGFALSAAATGALLVLAAPLATKLSRFMPSSFALAIAVPLAAQLVCAPIIILMDPYVSVVGTFANLVAAPAAPIATIVGLLACLLMIIPGVGFALCAVAWVPASWIAAVAEVAMMIPLGRMAWPEGVAGALLLAVVTLAALGVIFAVSTRNRLIALTTIAATVAAALGGMAVRTIIAPSAVPEGWSVAACDVGQGDAMIVKSGDAIALIDAGQDSAALGRCLELLQISHISVMILTHFDLDHVGGTDAVRGRVDVIVHGPIPDGVGRERLEGLEDAGAVLMPAQAGMTGEFGDASWSVLWPKPRAEPGNDASVVWEVSGGEVPRSLFLGDLSAAAQQSLIATGAIRGPYDLVKVAHHGSADQESRLYALASANIALIGVGENTYGHPRQEAIDMVESNGAAVFRTDRDGTITVSRRTDGWGIWREYSHGETE